jgi:hypothetical protein
MVMSKSSRTSSAVRTNDSETRPENPSDDKRPVHTIRYRNLKGAIWKNAGGNGDFYTVTLSRAYQDKQEQWHDVTSFNTGDLPMLAKLANDCHSWITWQERKATEEKGERQ